MGAKAHPSTISRVNPPTSCLAFDDSSDSDNDSQGEDDYFDRVRMVARQLGDLPSLRTRVDFCTLISSASQIPAEFKLSDEEIKLFESRFDLGSYGLLDSL